MKSIRRGRSNSGRITHSLRDIEMPPSRDYNLKPVEFNESTRLPNPSVSPRERLEFVSDRKSHSAAADFIQKNPTFKLFLSELKISVIRDKPVDILNYLVEEFFSERSQINIKEKIAEHETIANKLRHGGEVD